MKLSHTRDESDITESMMLHLRQQLETVVPPEHLETQVINAFEYFRQLGQDPRNFSIIGVNGSLRWFKEESD